jgi:hypothetical protein
VRGFATPGRFLFRKNTCLIKVTLVERSQLEIEQFLELLQFETRGKLEELPGFLK